ncbi:MAG: tail fiber domain-containing protein [Patescibacteria group bacterium]|nr:tail fiber domain-containing protein [Patescibacteria group bacterium]
MRRKIGAIWGQIIATGTDPNGFGAAFFTLLAAGGVIALSFAMASASGPSTNTVLNYQARLTDTSGVAVVDGAHNVKFVIYDAAVAGNCKWTARGACGAETAKSVTVSSGTFSTLLGEAGDNVMPTSLFSGNETRWLEIRVETAVPTVYETLAPRKRIVAAPYSMNADLLDDLDTSAIGGTAAFVPVTDASGLLTLTGTPTIANGVITANPAAPPANGLLINLRNNGAARFSVDAEGDTAIAGTLDVSGATGARIAVSDTVGLTLKATHLTSDYVGVRWTDNADASLWTMGNDYNGDGTQNFWLYDNVNFLDVLYVDQLATSYLSFGTTLGGIQYDDVTNKLGLFTNGFIGFTMDGTGKVGLGTATPSQKLTVGDGGNVLLNSGQLASAYGGFGRFENFVTYSEVFDNVNWTKESTIAITANGQAAPNGVVSADTVTTGGAGAANGVTQSASGAPVTASTTWTGSVWMKRTAGTATVNLRVSSGNETGTATAAIVTTSWQRFSVTQAFTAGSTGTSTFRIETGTNTGVILWGAQLEQQATPGVYTDTGGQAVTETSYGLASTGSPSVVLDIGAPSVAGASKLVFGWAGAATGKTYAHSIRTSGGDNTNIAWDIVDPTNHYLAINGNFAVGFNNGGASVGYNVSTTTPPLNGLIVSGNVGIGDSTPSATLTVGDGAGTETFTVAGATGNISTLGDLNVNGGDLDSSAAIFNVGTSVSTLNLAGGSGGNGCTVDGATGNLTCSGTFTGTITESDTLALVTGRGSTTATAVTLTGGAIVRGLTVDTSTVTDDLISVSVTAGGVGRFTGTITNADLTAPHTWTLPDAGGTFAVSASGNIALSSAGNVTFTGTLPVGSGGTGTATAFTQGSVVFAGASGTYSEDNANFFWDDTNNRLGIGATTPSGRLHIKDSGVDLLEVGNYTISNLEPSPLTVRYNSRIYPIAVGGSNESAAMYMRVDPTGAANMLGGIYGEITSNQEDTENGVFKVIHQGHGDAIYAALYGTSSVAMEAATFTDGTKGIISTVQAAGLGNSTLFTALWEQVTIPNYGMYLAQQAPARALTIQKFTTAPDGWEQIRLVENDYSRNRFAVFNSGETHIASAAATAGSTLKDSPQFIMRGAYWDGAQSVDRNVIFKQPVTGAAASDFRIYIGDAGSETLEAILSTTSLDLQANNLVGVTDITNSGTINANGGTIATTAGTFNLVNANATTVNLAGAATSLVIGATSGTATVRNATVALGGNAAATELRFLEPSGSGSDYTAFKAQAQATSLVYTFPAAFGAAGTVLTDAAGNGTLSWAAPASSTRLDQLLAATATNTIANANFAQTWNWGTLTSQTGLTLGGGSAMTTGSLLAIDSATYVHTGLAETGSLVSIGLVDNSTATGGAATTNGLLVSSSMNTTGLANKTVTGVSVAAPTLTGCTGNPYCTWNGFQTATGAYSQGAGNTFYMNAFNLSAAGNVATTSGTLNWTGLNVNTPALTQTAGTLTAVGLNVTEGNVNSGTLIGLKITGPGTMNGNNFAIVTDSTAGNVGIGTGYYTAQTPKTPVARLQIARASASTTIQLTDEYIHLGGAESVINMYTLIGFGSHSYLSSATTSQAYIGYQETFHRSSNSGDLVFGTRYSGDPFTTATERLRVTNLGNVGVGTGASRLSRLTVKGLADVSPLTDSLQSFADTTVANNTTTITANNGNGAWFTHNVGIGDRISLSSAASTYATVTAIADDNNLTVDAPLGNGTSQTINLKSSLFRADDASGATKFVISDRGYVGIGDTGPSASLAVGDGAGNENFTVNGSTGAVAQVTGAAGSAGYALTANSLTTGSALSISSTSAITTGSLINATYSGAMAGNAVGVNLDMTDSGTSALTRYGQKISVTHSGNMGVGAGSDTIYGLNVAASDTGTNSVGSTTTVYGGYFTASDNTTGSGAMAMGLYGSAAGGSSNYAIYGQINVATGSPASNQYGVSGLLSGAWSTGNNANLYGAKLDNTATFTGTVDSPTKYGAYVSATGNWYSGKDYGLYVTNTSPNTSSNPGNRYGGYVELTNDAFADNYGLDISNATTNSTTAANKYGLRVQSTGVYDGDVNATTNYGIYADASGADTNYGLYVAAGNTAIYVPSVGAGVSLCTSGSGNDVGTIQTCSSSRRYKDNIAALPFDESKFYRLQPVSYTWKAPGSAGPTIGFIAEDVAELYPQVVTHNVDGSIQGIEYGNLTAILFGAIKDVHDRALQLDGNGSSAYEIKTNGTPTVDAQTANSKTLAFAGASWDSVTNQLTTRRISLSNIVTDATDQRLSITNDEGQEIAFFGSNGDAAIKGHLKLGGSAGASLGYDAVSERLTTSASGFSAPSTGFAEAMPSGDYLTAGDIVMVDVANPGNVKRSDSTKVTNGYLVAGVVAERPGYLAGPDEIDTYPVTVAGRVTVKVNLENGPIAIGDAVAIANVPGVGKKADPNSYVVGIALEPFDPATGHGEADAIGVGTITVFLKIGWYDGRAVEQAANSASTGSLAGATSLPNMNGQPIIGIGALEGIDGLWSIDGNGKLTVKEMVTEQAGVKVTDTSKTIGSAFIPAGNSDVTVQNTSVKKNSKVFVTFRRSPKSEWWIELIDDGMFIVKTEQPVPEDTVFDYWVIQVVDETTPPEVEAAPAAETPTEIVPPPGDAPADLGSTPPPSELPPAPEAPAPEETPAPQETTTP